jgi:SAM-dependent methyltransferase
MRLLGWLRRAPQAPAPSTGEPPRRWTWIGGRRILGIGSYVLPKDKIEGDRLDLQHHLLKVAVGRNYRAPIRVPRTILDVASGTGIWAREMAQEFPHAQVIAFDIDRTPMERSLERLGPHGLFPRNFRFIEANALERFPFEDEQFDFTHSRFMSPFVPRSRWPGVVAEMARVTRRGGYVEMVEMNRAMTPSVAFNAIQDVADRLWVARGLSNNAAQELPDHFRQAGLSRVQQRQVMLGERRSMRQARNLLIADLLAVFTNMAPFIIKSGLISAEDYEALLGQAREELPRLGIVWPITFVFSLRL